jgi:hypothetical protein
MVFPYPEPAITSASFFSRILSSERTGLGLGAAWETLGVHNFDDNTGRRRRSIMNLSGVFQFRLYIVLPIASLYLHADRILFFILEWGIFGRPLSNTFSMWLNRRISFQSIFPNGCN